jgi:hypothetical protein
LLGGWLGSAVYLDLAALFALFVVILFVVLAILVIDYNIMLIIILSNIMS